MKTLQKKTLFLKVAGGTVFALVFLFNITALQQTANAQKPVPPSCKWKLTDCPGLGTGDYEACLTNGDGNTCTCGSVSRECPKSE